MKILKFLDLSKKIWNRRKSKKIEKFEISWRQKSKKFLNFLNLKTNFHFKTSTLAKSFQEDQENRIQWERKFSKKFLSKTILYDLSEHLNWLLSGSMIWTCLCKQNNLNFFYFLRRKFFVFRARSQISWCQSFSFSFLMLVGSKGIWFRYSAFKIDDWSAIRITNQFIFMLVKAENKKKIMQFIAGILFVENFW